MSEIMNRRDVIDELQYHMQELPECVGPEAFPLQHSFAKGLYVRQISVPKGVLIISQIHRYSNAAFLLKGDISVFGTEGVYRIQAPASLITPAGTKRAVYHHEDTVFATVHATEETDVKKIEDEIYVKDFSDIDEIINAEFREDRQCLG
jgi:hypothetical protein